jgi:manganese efflux pump family protein
VSSLRTAALIVPLALDTFAVSAALGLAGLPARERRRAAILFPTFETLMPLRGLAACAALGRVVGSAADWLAIAVVLATGVWMLLEGGEEGAVGGHVGVALAVSVSLDELAIGFSLGLLGIPPVVAVLLIGLQAVVASQAGLRLGARLGERAGEWGERLAGAGLITLAAILALSRS